MQNWKHLVLRHESALGFAVVALSALACWLSWLVHAAFFAQSAWAVASGMTTFLMLKIGCRWQRERQLREAPLPQFLKRKLREIYPHLTGKDCDLVERGLRQFFLACLRSNRQFVAMPSRVVDAMWHEFILHTKAYQDWCSLTLGWFLHHTPAEVLGAKASSNDGLRRAWYWACRDEAIAPKAPTRLPLLFALDSKLQIAEGFRYLPDCADIQRKSEAGGDGSASYCGSIFRMAHSAATPTVLGASTRRILRMAEAQTAVATAAGAAVEATNFHSLRSGRMAHIPRAAPRNFS